MVASPAASARVVSAPFDAAPSGNAHGHGNLSFHRRSFCFLRRGGLPFPETTCNNIAGNIIGDDEDDDGDDIEVKT